jgi:prophage regulatory protein
MPLISRNEVLKRTSLSQATLWRKERAGEFPKAVKISTNRVAYDAKAVEAWIQFVLSTAEPEIKSGSADDEKDAA